MPFPVIAAGTGAAIAGLAAGAGHLLDFLGKPAERRDVRESQYKKDVQQYGMSRAADILEADTRAAQMEFLKGALPEIEEYQFTAPDEAIYDRLRTLGVEDISELGRFQQQAQAESMAARGLGASSLGIGASQRLAQRTAREIGRFEAGLAEQEARARFAYEQARAAEAGRVQSAQFEQAKLLGGLVGPTAEEVTAEYEPFKPVEPDPEYTFLEKLLPGGEAKGEGFFQKIFGG